MTQDKDTWRKQAEKELRGRPLDDLTWNTLEGIPVSPLYTADDVAGLDHMNTMPGIEPFTRGVRATMYTGRPWTIRQYAGFSTAEESMRFIVVLWLRVSRVFRWPLIWRHTVDTTAIMNA